MTHDASNFDSRAARPAPMPPRKMDVSWTLGAVYAPLDVQASDSDPFVKDMTFVSPTRVARARLTRTHACGESSRHETAPRRA